MSEESFGNIEAHLDSKIDGAKLTEGLSETEAAAVLADLDFARAARLAVEADAVREELAELHRKEQTEPVVTEKKPVASKRLALPRWWLSVAALGPIVVLGLWWLRPFGESDYQAYEYRDPGLAVLMGPTTDPAFTEAMILFKQGKFVEAEAGFAAMVTEEAVNDTLVYYSGASAYYAGKYDLAKWRLKIVADNETSLLRERAEWLLVLANLRSGGDSPATRAALQTILDQPAHRFAKYALELDATLNE